MVFYTQDYLVSVPRHLSHIEKMNTFAVQICSFIYWAGTDECSQSLDNTCQVKFLYNKTN